MRWPLTDGFVDQLATAQTGDGRPLPAAFRTRLAREWAHLEAIATRLGTLTAARDEPSATGTDRVATVARQLCTLRAVAETSAAVLSAELFGTRTFRTGRQLGARHLTAKDGGELGRLADRAVGIEEPLTECVQRGPAMKDEVVAVFDLGQKQPMLTGGLAPLGGCKERGERTEPFLGAAVQIARCQRVRQLLEPS